MDQFNPQFFNPNWIAVKIIGFHACRCVRARVFSLSSNAVGGEGWGEEEREEIYGLSSTNGIAQLLNHNPPNHQPSSHP